MKTHISETSKIEIIKRNINGESVDLISQNISIPKSTIYYWISRYGKDIRKKTPARTVLELDHARTRIKKLEGIIEVLRAVDCTASAPLKHKLEALAPLYGKYSIYTLCEALDVSRGTFYNHILRNKRNGAWFIKRREDLKSQIQTVYDESNQIFGAIKIRIALVNKGYAVSDKIVSELMNEMGLHSIRISSKKDDYKFRRDERKINMLKQNFKVDQPNKVWVSDVTCYKFKESYFYICVFIDLFSRRVLALSIGKNNSTHLVRTAFASAFQSRKPEGSLTIHTDRGTPYTSYSMQNLVRTCGVTQSYSNPGRPHDNAVMESFFATLKKEELYRSKYKSEAELRESINRYANFYNIVRLHKFLNYKTPGQAEDAFWKNPKTIR